METSMRDQLNKVLDKLEEGGTFRFDCKDDFLGFLSLVETSVPERFFPMAHTWQYDPDRGVGCNWQNHQICYDDLESTRKRILRYSDYFGVRLEPLDGLI